MSLARLDVWKDRDGRVRVGWVVGAFALLGVLTYALVAWAFIEQGLIKLWAPRRLDSPALLFETLPTLLAAAVATLACRALFREPAGLADARGLRHAGLGAAWGLAAGCAAVLVPVAVGALALSPSPKPALEIAKMGLLQLATLGPAGLAEELFMRGLAFQAVRRRLGDAVAVLASGLVFGLLHLDNPEGSWVSTLIIALVGCWFALLTVRSGSVWMAVGVHVSWNWVEGFLFGQPVSGHPAASPAFSSTVAASAGFWVGGPFGPEAAGWTVVVLAVALLATVFVSPRMAGR